jgi:exopolysaccharide biosynthesis polyprenyl glycosylphosphotransferase
MHPKGVRMSVDPHELALVESDSGLSSVMTSARRQAVPHERRLQVVPSRRSWASTEPFVLDGSQERLVDPRERAARRRETWMRPMRWRALVSDLVTAAGVTGACIWSVPADRRLAPMAMLAAGTVWTGAVRLADGYEAGRMGDGAEAFQAIMRAGLGIVTAMGVLAYLMQEVFFHEMVVAVPATVVLTMVLRHLLRQSLHRKRYGGEAMWRTLLVGDSRHIERVSMDLNGRESHGFQVVGACTATVGGVAPDGVEVLGVVPEVPQVVVDHDIDAVIVVGSQLSGGALRRLSWAIERTGAQLLVEPGLVEVAGPNISLRPAAGLSLLHLESPSSRPGRLIGKSVLDRLLGSVLLLLATPVILASAIAVKLTSRGPAFFRQTRMGLDGRTFTMFKVRSMVVDAVQRQLGLLAQNGRDGLMFKMRRDPRVTAVGSVLRRYSLDELPQLLNVVRGDMSLVGPRPPLTSEYEHYHDAVFRRLRVKPGLTGLWQVSGRADLSWEESVRLDLRYVDNWSLALDLLILWKTARAVLGRSGAY